MTQTAAVQFDHVSKYFTLDRSRPRSIQELLLHRRKPPQGHEKLRVLKDVSFSLDPGTTTGFIGVNGAGKSTALKLISGIIKPTSGMITTKGRIGALLELGAGFHPDLTGRENVYLNAAILGLDRLYVNRIFDKIVAFSELDDFIDAPVKHYSSGMYIRLGFSIAVHTEPEILLIDEVLAVGDTAFQHKCLERISTLRREGVTIVLVTHDLNSVQTLCHSAIWFSDGQIAAQGNSRDVTLDYLSYVAEKEEHIRQEAEASTSTVISGRKKDKARRGTRRVEIVQVDLLDSQLRTSSSFRTGDEMILRIHYHARDPVQEPTFGMAVFHETGIHVSGPNTFFGNMHIDCVHGHGYVDYRIPKLTLLDGGYDISVAVHEKSDAEMYDYHDRILHFRVYPGTKEDERYGLVTLQGTWSLHSDTK